jgi:hypothetical protein
MIGNTRPRIVPGVTTSKDVTHPEEPAVVNRHGRLFPVSAVFL